MIGRVAEGPSRWATACLVLAVVLAACAGKKRPFADEPGTMSTQPSSEPDASARGSEPHQGVAPEGVGASDLAADGRIDDSSCQTGVDGGCRSEDPCAGDASCEATCPGCFINGDCVGIGALEADNPCHVCDPSVDPRGWSDNDEPCDDGLFCTIDDICSAGSCIGTSRECEDGIACNGVSTCQEDSDSCSAPASQCGSDSVCDVATDSCSSTCEGCVVRGVCVAPGSEAPGNPCLVCDPVQTTTDYAIGVGKRCGSGQSACSAEDTCDDQGRCQPNHLPANTPCGNSSSSACDQPDGCDGAGNCQQRLASNGVPCDDEAFCTTGDRCQGGQCVPTAQRNCGANSRCDEASNQCQCQGCQLGGNCVGAASTNPSNVCQVCDPSRSVTQYSINIGASCGAGPTECSAQDTCNAQAQCAANNQTDGTPCFSQPGGSCQSGQCVAARQPIGTTCNVAGQCLSGFCRLWFQDLDFDSHGDPNQRQMLCSPDPADDEIVSQANGQRMAILAVGSIQFSSVGDDCCDAALAAAGSVFPGNTNFLTLPQTACPGLDPFDYDCSGRVTDFLQNRTIDNPGCLNTCADLLWVPPVPACGQTGQTQQCQFSNGVCSLAPPSLALRACN
jgi:hypothetical protein